jgi:hypothetical protein
MLGTLKQGLGRLNHDPSDRGLDHAGPVGSPLYDRVSQCNLGVPSWSNYEQV